MPIIERFAYAIPRTFFQCAEGLAEYLRVVK